MQSLSTEHLRHALADDGFKEKVLKLVQLKDSDNKRLIWFQQNHADKFLKCAVYFSMEYMLSEALPIYSGGLGNVAEDQLKAASDLGVPVVGVGLLYQQGYFRQVVGINHD
jgi:starch phosphorylase